MLGAVVVGAAALGVGALIGKLVYDYCSNKNNQKLDKHKDDQKQNRTNNL